MLPYSYLTESLLKTPFRVSVETSDKNFIQEFIAHCNYLRRDCMYKVPCHSRRLEDENEVKTCKLCTIFDEVVNNWDAHKIREILDLHKTREKLRKKRQCLYCDTEYRDGKTVGVYECTREFGSKSNPFIKKAMHTSKRFSATRKVRVYEFITGLVNWFSKDAVSTLHIVPCDGSHWPDIDLSYFEIHLVQNPIFERPERPKKPHDQTTCAFIGCCNKPSYRKYQSLEGRIERTDIKKTHLKYNHSNVCSICYYINK